MEGSILTTTKKTSNADGFLKLVQRFPLRPLRNAREHEQAIGMTTELMRESPPITQHERDYLGTLALLIRDFEQKHWPRPRKKSDPVQMLRHLMEQGDLSVSDIGRVIGSQSAASLVLAGKRELSKSHIRRLADRFKVSAGVFL